MTAARKSTRRALTAAVPCAVAFLLLVPSLSWSAADGTAHDGRTSVTGSTTIPPPPAAPALATGGAAPLPAKAGPSASIPKEITAPTVFAKAAGPHVINGMVTIARGVTVTVEPGTVLEFQNGAVLHVRGTLALRGSAEQPVTIRGSGYELQFVDASTGGAVFEHAVLSGGTRITSENSFLSLNNTRITGFETAIKISGGRIAGGAIEIAGCATGIEAQGNVRFDITSARITGGKLAVASAMPVEIGELALGTSDKTEIIRQIRGDVTVRRIVPLDLSFADIRRDILNSRKELLASALVAGNMAQARQTADAMKPLFPQEFSELADVVAYVHFQTGDTAGAREIVQKNSPKAEPFLLSVFGSGDSGTAKAEYAVMFLDVRIPIGDSVDNIDKESVSRAQRRAVRAFIDAHVPDIDRDKRAVLDGKILPKSSSYVIHVTPISTVLGPLRYDGSFMAIVSQTKLLGDLRDLKIVGGGRRGLKLGIVDCNGSGYLRQLLQKRLASFGFEIEDMGTGACDPANHAERALDHEIDVVFFVNDRHKITPSLVGSNLKKVDATVEITGFDPYLQSSVFNVSKPGSVYHLTEDKGREDALRQAFASIDERLEQDVNGIERTLSSDTKRQAVKHAFYAEKHLPPLEIRIDKAERIFANNYKTYVDKPFVALTLVNNTRKDIEKIALSINVGGYMDSPSETVIDRIAAMKSMTVRLGGTFSNRILEISEATPVLADIKVRYVREGVEKEVAATHTVELHAKNALVWDDSRKIGIFVTPNDPVVVDLSREISRAARPSTIGRNITLAMAVFEAMRSLGMTYQIDPNSPYTKASVNAETIDYVQFARDSLKRKTGDCDDLVSLFCSLMESLGVATAAIDYPGHILAMADTGIAAADIASHALDDEELVIADGRAWLPVELTLLGEGFPAAWKKGAGNYRANVDRGLKLVFIQQAWQAYKPPTLPEAKLDIYLPPRFADLFMQASKSLAAERNARALSLARQQKIRLETVLYSLFTGGAVEDARNAAQDFVAKGINAPGVYNDAGNVEYLSGNYDAALKMYERAAKGDARNPFYVRNVIKALRKLGRTKEADDLEATLKKSADYLW